MGSGVHGYRSRGFGMDWRSEHGALATIGRHTCIRTGIGGVSIVLVDLIRAVRIIHMQRLYFHFRSCSYSTCKLNADPQTKSWYCTSPIVHISIDINCGKAAT